MKLIHCADLHLDASMTSNLSKEKAKERKNELLMTFNRMIQYAREEGVCAILIAGDLFDRKKVSKTAFNTVWQAITENPQIEFYYLEGNHGVGAMFGSLDDVPGNLRLFGDKWTEYDIEDESGERITINGIELNEDNSAKAQDGLVLNPDFFNIVMLHGQEAEHSSKDKAEVINIRAFKNRGIDYMALGHIHSYREGTLDGRGVYCYCGCLEGRGFDECGEHGFVLLDINPQEHSCVRTFVPIAGRSIYALDIDITGCNTSVDIVKRIEAELAHADKSGEVSAEGVVIEDRAGNGAGAGYKYSKDCLMKFILTGEVDIESEIDTGYLLKHFEDRFYFLKIYDETRLRVNYDAFALDISLKGEFVRAVMDDSQLDEDEKADIIRCGIRILAGEEN